MLVAWELLITLHFLQPLASMILAAEYLLHLLNCVELPVIPTSNFKDFSEASLAQLANGIKALLVVGVILRFIVKAARQSLERRAPGSRCWRYLRRVERIFERNCLDFVMSVSDEAIFFREKLWRLFDSSVLILRVELKICFIWNCKQWIFKCLCKFLP